MVEGYIVDVSFYYASEHIKKIDDTQGALVWEDQLDEEKREGELIQTNKKWCMINSISLIFCQIIVQRNCLHRS